MMFRTKLLLFFNKMFKAPVHPFNLQNEGVMTYAEWQFEKGEDTIALYLKNYSTDEMFKDKTVVDIGCGAAGKSLYYASCGAKEVIGVDILEKYREEAVPPSWGFPTVSVLLPPTPQSFPLRRTASTPSL